MHNFPNLNIQELYKMYLFLYRLLKVLASKFTVYVAKIIIQNVNISIGYVYYLTIRYLMLIIAT